MSPGLVELRAGAATLRLAPALGGRVTACTLADAAGRPQAVLHPYSEAHTDLDLWAKGGVYPLVPYSGRIRHARLRHAGRDWALAPYPGSPHTLHGIAQRRPWSLLEQSDTQARLQYTHTADAHWPWPFEAELSVILAPQCMAMGITLRNTGTQTMPAGIGLHPYLPHQADDHLGFEAGKPWPFDADCLALPPPMGVWVPRPQQLDAAAFALGEVTAFHAAWAGALQVRSGAHGPVRLALQGSGALDQLVIHRPAQSPYVCIEPVSHVADGFHLDAQGVAGTGVRVLAPGEVLAGGLSLTLG